MHGYNGKEILENMNINEVYYFTDNICRLINLFKSFRNKDNNSKNKLINKINDLYSSVDEYFYKYLDFSLNKIKKIKNFESTFCHGDFTLSNLIIEKNIGFNNKLSNIYIFDWTDIYFEHYLQDIAKLKQDLYFGWSTRNFDDTNLEYELNSLFIWEKIFKSFINNSNYELFKIFMILCLLRIIPYSKNKNDIEWIDKFLNKEIKNL